MNLVWPGSSDLLFVPLASFLTRSTISSPTSSSVASPFGIRPALISIPSLKRSCLCNGVDEAGDAIVIVDENAEILEEYARIAKNNPDAFLDLHTVFGNPQKDTLFRRLALRLY